MWLIQSLYIFTKILNRRKRKPQLGQIDVEVNYVFYSVCTVEGNCNYVSSSIRSFQSYQQSVIKCSLLHFSGQTLALCNHGRISSLKSFVFNTTVIFTANHFYYVSCISSQLWKGSGKQFALCMTQINIIRIFRTKNSPRHLSSI